MSAAMLKNLPAMLLVAVGAGIGLTHRNVLMGAGILVVAALYSLILFLMSGHDSAEAPRGKMASAHTYVAVLTALIGVSLSGYFIVAEADTLFTVQRTDRERGVAQTSDETPAAIGERVFVGDWRVTVNSAQMTATNEVMTISGNSEPNVGNKYVLVGVSVTYLGTEEDVFLSRLIFRGDVNDTTFYPFNAAANAPLPLDPLKTLRPNQTVEGNILFELPIDIYEFNLRLFADDQPAEVFAIR